VNTTTTFHATPTPALLYHATTMLTVPEAAKRTGRNPETVRRWIREGKLRAHKVGTQHVIEEQDLEAMQHGDYPDMLPLPKEWGWEKTFWGAPMPNVAAWIRESRAGH
jgi:excisionase family DNA binding protein